MQLTFGYCDTIYLPGCLGPATDLLFVELTKGQRDLESKRVVQSALCQFCINMLYMAGKENDYPLCF